MRSRAIVNLPSYFPAEPLLTALERKYPEGAPVSTASLDYVPGRDENVQQHINRLRRRSEVRWDTVDNICVNYLDCHPAAIYGYEWFGITEPGQVAA